MSREYCVNCGRVGCDGCEPVESSTKCKKCNSLMYEQHGDGIIYLECFNCGNEIHEKIKTKRPPKESEESYS